MRIFRNLRLVVADKDEETFAWLEYQVVNGDMFEPPNKLRIDAKKFEKTNLDKLIEEEVDKIIKEEGLDYE